MKARCVAWIPDSKCRDFGSTHLEWCACRTQPTKNPKKYRDSMRTKCAHHVVLTVGIAFRKPTCPECKKKLSHT